MWSPLKWTSALRFMLLLLNRSILNHTRAKGHHTFVQLLLRPTLLLWLFCSHVPLLSFFSSPLETQRSTGLMVFPSMTPSLLLQRLLPLIWFLDWTMTCFPSFKVNLLEAGLLCFQSLACLSHRFMLHAGPGCPHEWIVDFYDTVFAGTPCVGKKTFSCTHKRFRTNVSFICMCHEKHMKVDFLQSLRRSPWCFCVCRRTLSLAAMLHLFLVIGVFSLCNSSNSH